MADLGRCLLFYLKYRVEMERLYETDEPATDGLENPIETLGKVRLVGAAGEREGGELLKACSPVVEAHFREIARIERTRVNPEKRWQISFCVKPKGSEKNFQVGISLYADNRPRLVPWIWCRGGRAAEAKMLGALNSIAEEITIGSSAYMGWSSGSISLGQVEIDVPNDLNEQVAGERLIEQVGELFALLTEEHVKSLAEISGTK